MCIVAFEEEGGDEWRLSGVCQADKKGVLECYMEENGALGIAGGGGASWYQVGSGALQAGSGAGLHLKKASGQQALSQQQALLSFAIHYTYRALLLSRHIYLADLILPEVHIISPFLQKKKNDTH